MKKWGLISETEVCIVTESSLAIRWYTIIFVNTVFNQNLNKYII